MMVNQSDDFAILYPDLLQRREFEGIMERANAMKSGEFRDVYLCKNLLNDIEWKKVWMISSFYRFMIAKNDFISIINYSHDRLGQVRIWKKPRNMRRRRYLGRPSDFIISLDATDSRPDEGFWISKSQCLAIIKYCFEHHISYRISDFGDDLSQLHDDSSNSWFMFPRTVIWNTLGFGHEFLDIHAEDHECYRFDDRIELWIEQTYELKDGEILIKQQISIADGNYFIYGSGENATKFPLDDLIHFDLPISSIGDVLL